MWFVWPPTASSRTARSLCSSPRRSGRTPSAARSTGAIPTLRIPSSTCAPMATQSPTVRSAPPCRRHACSSFDRRLWWTCSVRSRAQRPCHLLNGHCCSTRRVRVYAARLRSARCVQQHRLSSSSRLFWVRPSASSWATSRSHTAPSFSTRPGLRRSICSCAAAQPRAVHSTIRPSPFRAWTPPRESWSSTARAARTRLTLRWCSARRRTSPWPSRCVASTGPTRPLPRRRWAALITAL